MAGPVSAPSRRNLRVASAALKPPRVSQAAMGLHYSRLSTRLRRGVEASESGGSNHPFLEVRTPKVRVWVFYLPTCSQHMKVVVPREINVRNLNSHASESWRPLGQKPNAIAPEHV